MKSIMANHGRMFVEKTQVLLPQGTNEALKAASGRKYVRPAQYCRESILDRLEADGICLVPSREATGS